MYKNICCTWLSIPFLFHCMAAASVRHIFSCLLVTRAAVSPAVGWGSLPTKMLLWFCSMPCLSRFHWARLLLPGQPGHRVPTVQPQLGQTLRDTDGPVLPEAALITATWIVRCRKRELRAGIRVQVLESPTSESNNKYWVTLPSLLACLSASSGVCMHAE